ncbi:hypothetical protein WJU23_02670 [Prosthecobacter sp. SYSU 5D2]|uniref:hypothetical protein n=1 Tax=Prosthecobacter sp. SYSU 5D2 TaxID=3134134 RepID=UPI0031FF2685
MKWTLPILILACLIGFGIMIYDGQVNESQAQVPEDKKRVPSETVGTGDNAVNGVDSESGNPVPKPAAQASLDDLWVEAMDIPSDHKLIMAEFRKRGGVVKEEALEKDIDSIVRDHFGNDRSAFIASLKSKGLTLEEFRSQRHDLMAVQAIKGYITRGITDSVEKQEKVDEWLRGLRKSASPGTAALDED